MEIVHEVNQLEYGGVERVVKNIIKFDGKNEHTIVTYKDGPFRKELEEVGAKIVVVNKDDKDQEDLELCADIIHVHTGGDVSNMALHLAGAFPVIETIHSPVRSAMTNEYVKQRIGVSEAVSKINHNCQTIVNGLDVDNFEATKSIEEIKAELKIPEGKLVIGRLGRLGRDKGVEEFLLTCYELQQEGLDFIPLIVGAPGKDDQKYLGKLKLMAASLPLNGVIWAGHKDDPANYMQVMDIFLYPSPTEGFGLVFAEAMLSNCIVVAYKTEVTWELFAGYAILTEKTIPALVRGVKKALETEIRDELLGIQASFIRSNYDAEDMSVKYQELYESCK